MLSLSSQLRLKNLLVAIGRHELDIESLRLAISRLDTFEPYAAYRLLDSVNKKAILKDDV